MNNSKPPLPLTKLDGLIAVVISLVAFALYARTLAPGLLPGDSGEFQTLAYLWGHTHPTGYPVYLLLAKPFIWLPVGEIAYRVNLFSAFMAGITAGGVYLCGRLLTAHQWPPILSALALAVSPTFWSQAVIAEVYTAGAAFLVAILLALLLWDATGQVKFLLIAGVLGGFALGVHLIVTLFAPAVLVFLVIGQHAGRRAWQFAISGGALGVLAAVLIFLMVDWFNSPANYFDTVVRPSQSAWGMVETDLDNPFERLFFGFSARQFSSLMFTDIAQVMPEQARNYWDNLPSELSWLLILPAALGILVLFLRNRPVGVLFGIGLAVQWFYTFNYQIWDISNFFIPGYVLLVVLAAAGLGGLVDGLHRVILSKPLCVLVETALILAILVFGIWPVFAPQRNALFAGEIPFDEYPADSEQLQGFHLSLTTVVKNIPQNAIVFVDWDILYPLYYVAHIEQERTDLTFIEAFPHNDAKKPATSMVDYVQLQINERPVIFATFVPELAAAGYTFNPIQIGSQNEFFVVEPTALKKQ